MRLSSLSAGWRTPTVAAGAIAERAAAAGDRPASCVRGSSKGSAHVSLSPEGAAEQLAAHRRGGAAGVRGLRRRFRPLRQPLRAVHRLRICARRMDAARRHSSGPSSTRSGSACRILRSRLPATWRCALVRQHAGIRASRLARRTGERGARRPPPSVVPRAGAGDDRPFRRRARDSLRPAYKVRRSGLDDPLALATGHVRSEVELLAGDPAAAAEFAERRLPPARAGRRQELAIDRVRTPRASAVPARPARRSRRAPPPGQPNSAPATTP